MIVSIEKTGGASWIVGEGLRHYYDVTFSITVNNVGFLPVQRLSLNRVELEQLCRDTGFLLDNVTKQKSL